MNMWKGVDSICKLSVIPPQKVCHIQTTLLEGNGCLHLKMCVGTRVCLCERERKRKRESEKESKRKTEMLYLSLTWRRIVSEWGYNCMRRRIHSIYCSFLPVSTFCLAWYHFTGSPDFPESLRGHVAHLLTLLPFELSWEIFPGAVLRLPAVTLTFDLLKTETKSE